MTAGDAAGAIVVLNWNGGEDTLACLGSLAEVGLARRST